MASLYKAAHQKPISLYKDRRFDGGQQQREALLLQSTTLYVGNLSFYTTEEQIFELFSKAGEIKRIVMGLDRNKKTPCGFCFVEYFTRRDAEASVRHLSGLQLDERFIRVDYDVGFAPGRQYGRGRSGGQVRDEYRTDYDPGRGGYGHAPAMTGMQMWGGHDIPGPPPPRNNQRMRGGGGGGRHGGPRNGRHGPPGPPGHHRMPPGMPYGGPGMPPGPGGPRGMRGPGGPGGPGGYRQGRRQSYPPPQFDQPPYGGGGGPRHGGGVGMKRRRESWGEDSIHSGGMRNGGPPMSLAMTAPLGARDGRGGAPPPPQGGFVMDRTGDGSNVGADAFEEDRRPNKQAKVDHEPEEKPSQRGRFDRGGDADDD